MEKSALILCIILSILTFISFLITTISILILKQMDIRRQENIINKMDIRRQEKYN